jgi:hypothetical protein
MGKRYFLLVCFLSPRLIFSSCFFPLSKMFPDGHEMNRDISLSPVSPKSGTYLANVGGGNLHVDFGSTYLGSPMGIPMVSSLLSVVGFLNCSPFPSFVPFAGRCWRWLPQDVCFLPLQ